MLSTGASVLGNYMFNLSQKGNEQDHLLRGINEVHKWEKANHNNSEEERNGVVRDMDQKIVST